MGCDGLLFEGGVAVMVGVVVGVGRAPWPAVALTLALSHGGERGRVLLARVLR